MKRSRSVKNEINHMDQTDVSTEEMDHINNVCYVCVKDESSTKKVSVVESSTKKVSVVDLQENVVVMLVTPDSCPCMYANTNELKLRYGNNFDFSVLKNSSCATRSKDGIQIFDIFEYSDRGWETVHTHPWREMDCDINVFTSKNKCTIFVAKY